MRSFKITGIVIKRRNIGEADRILTVFTKELGKILIKAKGVRKITSKRSAQVEPLNYCSMSLYKGRGMAVLTEIELIYSFRAIKSELKKTVLAYHICELIDGLCPEEQENKQVFSTLLNTLIRLDSEFDSVSIIYEFEAELLSMLGYWPKGKTAKMFNAKQIIEGILERKLKTLQLLPQLQ